MNLTRKDLLGTSVTALILFVYLGSTQDWWYLGNIRWAAVTMLVIGIVGCPFSVRLAGEDIASPAIVTLGLLGVTAFALGVITIATAAEWALTALAIVVVVLWIGTTLRHAATPAHPHPAH